MAAALSALGSLSGLGLLGTVGCRLQSEGLGPAVGPCLDDCGSVDSSVDGSVDGADVVVVDAPEESAPPGTTVLGTFTGGNASGSGDGVTLHGSFLWNGNVRGSAGGITLEGSLH